MEANYKLTEKDYFNFNLFIFYGGIKKYIIGFSIAVFITMFALDIYQSIKYGFGMDTLSIVLYISFLLLFILIIPLILWFMAKKNFDNDENEVENQQYILSEDGITEIIGLRQFTVNWDKVFKVHETGKYFYLFIEKDKAFILPKRAFGEKENIKEAQKLFEQNLDKSKLKKL